MAQFQRPIFSRHAGIAALAIALASAVIGVSAPALADTKAGVDAWQAGDFATAIREWRTAADAGDADAAFNLGQAYKTGRGVTQDLNVALEWYGRAMGAGHVQAADYYGLTLYQMGRKSEAMPYIQASSARGEPRAQYVYGAELFNGKLIEKDWPRAYAMMNRASAQGLAPASRVLAEMDQHIPLDQRQQGLALSAQLEQNEGRERTRQMGNFDLASASAAPTPVRPAPPAPSSIERFELPPSASPAPSVGAPAPAPLPTSGYQPAYPAMPEVKRVPADAVVQGRSTERDDDELEELPPAPTAATAPVYASARPEAAPAYAPAPVNTPTYNPAPMPKAAQPAPVQSAPARAATPARAADGLPAGYVPSVGPRTAPPVKSAAAAPAPKPSPAPARAATPTLSTASGWRVQLGAYDNLNLAENHWYKLESKIPALTGHQPYLVKYKGIIRLQYGPFDSKSAADQSCAKVKSTGNACFVLKQ